MLSNAKTHSTGRPSRRWRRVWALAVVVVLSVCAVACGPSASQEPGGLTGAIRFRGGPSGAVIRQRQGGHVVLVRAHTAFASVRVRPGQRFSLYAPAGPYQLQARSGDARCRHTAVTLHAGAMAQVDMICDVR